STGSAPDHNEPATTRSRATRSAFAAGAANAAASAVTLFPSGDPRRRCPAPVYCCPMGSIERATRGAASARQARASIARRWGISSATGGGHVARPRKVGKQRKPPRGEPRRLERVHREEV